MAEMIKSRLMEGIWQAEFEDLKSAEGIKVTLRDQPLPGAQTHKLGENHWAITVAIPAHILSDGVHSILITDANHVPLADISIVAGNAVADDLRSEIGLLRAELDMLKKAFRRHCVETMG